MIGIVYHIYCTGNWREVVAEQLARLKKSGLYDRADILWTTINDITDNRADIDNIMAQYPKFRVEYNITNNYEKPGIDKVRELGNAHPDLKILYFHTKGVSNDYTNNETRRRGVTGWRLCMEYFLIDKWEECLEKLDTFDNVGVTCVHGWFWGNFWWSQSKHIVKKPEAVGDRWAYEAWLNQGTPEATNYEFYHHEFWPYLSDFPSYFYDGSKNEEDATIELISATFGVPLFQIDSGYPIIEDPSKQIIDVTENVRKHLEANNFKKIETYPWSMVTPGDDPAPGFRKVLVVKYRMFGQEMTIGTGENYILKLGL
jgi:hypothetical protein